MDDVEFFHDFVLEFLELFSHFLHCLFEFIKEFGSVVLEGLEFEVEIAGIKLVIFLELLEVEFEGAGRMGFMFSISTHRTDQGIVPALFVQANEVQGLPLMELVLLAFQVIYFVPRLKIFNHLIIFKLLKLYFISSIATLVIGLEPWHILTVAP